MSNNIPTGLEALMRIVPLNDGAPLISRKFVDFRGQATDDPTFKDDAGQIVGRTIVASATGTVIPPNSVLALRTTSPGATRDFRPRDNYQALGDPGGGFFVWNSIDTRADDGATIIQASGFPTGRWNRAARQRREPVLVGANGGGADDTTAILAAFGVAAGAIAGRQ